MVEVNNQNPAGFIVASEHDQNYNKSCSTDLKLMSFSDFELFESLKGILLSSL